MSSNKPKYIEAIYPSPVRFDLEELAIDWDEVEEYWFKYSTLNIQFKNGTIKEYEYMLPTGVDVTRPISTRVYNKNWEPITDE